jgi:GTP cyclohydrolase II
MSVVRRIKAQPEKAQAEIASVDTQIGVPCSHGDARSEPLFVTFNGLSDHKEHIALVYSGCKWTAFSDEQQSATPLVRIHSKCLTGDTFGSRLCDCGPQLDYAQDEISEHGGVLLYMDQEGRGIGLYNKLKCYFLKATKGLDTYEANRHLNFPDDLRDYTAAAQMLSALGVSQIDLMTNNPDKVSQIKEHGISIEKMINTPTFETVENHDYLACKKDQTHHQLIIK